MNIKDTTALFVFIDDFCKLVNKHASNKLLATNAEKLKGRTPQIQISEMLTLYF